MKVLIINHKEVHELLSMRECIDVMADAFKILASGDVVQPLRQGVMLPDKSGLLGMMPGYLGGDVGLMGIKTVSVMPGNHGTEYDSHQGTVMLFEKEHGVLLAIVDAGEITAVRTAAASGLATELLARKDAHKLAILGSGAQGRSHLTAMLAARDIQQTTVWSPNRSRLEQYAEWAKSEHGVDVILADDPKSAVAGSDIICTTTGAPTPILMGEWIPAGCHINAAGSSIKQTRELDTAAVVNASLFVDLQESTVNEAGDFLFPKAEGAVDDSHILANLGEILTGDHAGRTSDDEITLFKSLGLAIEDIASSNFVYEKAKAAGVGTWIEIGSKRDA